MTRGERKGKRRDRVALLHLLFLSCAACLPALIVNGCGAPAAPQPPTLNLPQPVRDLAATRVGDTVHLTYSVPEKTTDKLPVKGAMTAQLCRATSDSGPCEPAGTVAFSTQQKAVAMDDVLPRDLTQGPLRLLIYRVAVLNHAQKSDGESSAAFAVAGDSPAAIADFRTLPRRDGIVLAWQGDAPGQTTDWVRFERTRTAGPSAPPPQAGMAAGKQEEEPAERSLRVAEATAQHRPGTDRLFALDATARTGRSYRYTAQRVEQVQLGKHTLELSSAVSATLDVVYRDVFPPSVPVGLVSAVDTMGKAVDLSWTPDVDQGLAGYIVYRRVLGADGGTAPERISPREPVTAPAWRDTAIVAGQRYAYSVSAIDSSGNESKRSAEVEDGLAANGP